VKYLLSLLICALFIPGCSAFSLHKIRALTGTREAAVRTLPAPHEGEIGHPRTSETDVRSSSGDPVRSAAIDESAADRF
jgi:hypothetical protein